MTISSRRSQLIWSPVVGWVLLACVPPAQAQMTVGTTPTTSSTTPSTTSSTTTSSTPPTSAAASLPSYATTIVGSPFGTSVPVTTPEPTITGGVARSDDQELGVRMGAFYLYPQVEMNGGYDSNVFAQSSSLGTTGSLYTTVSPSFELRSNWSNHQLRFVAGGGVGFYASAPTQNYVNFNLLGDGRLDIDYDFYATGSFGVIRNTEALGTPNSVAAGAPTVAYSAPLNLGLYKKFNRFFVNPTVSATKFWYEDYSVITSQGLPAASRERTEYLESIRFGYELTEDFSVFLQPNLNQIRYVQTIDSAGQNRNADGATLTTGVTWKLNEISILEGSVGYTQLNDQSLGNTSAYTVGLSGTWTGYAPLTIRPNISRGINQSALSSYSAYVSSIIGLDFNYIIHDAWTMVGGLSYTTADYTPVPGAGVGPRTDTYLRGQLGVLYTLRPQVQIGPTFEYSSGSSTDPVNGPSFQRQIFSVRLIARH
jgi:hypothetical protein